MIKVDRVSKFFESAAAVKDISFHVQDGENFILLGTSGCGKTTTLKMINRLVPATSGTISVNGKNVADQSPEILRRGIGYVLQYHSLFPHYTIAENIAVVPKLLKWSKNKTVARTSELMEKLHLPESYKNKYPHQLSGGEAQRINLARALVADPPILLMDEPFGALDPITRAAIRKDFSALDEFKRKTIIMVTHDVHEAFELGDRICLMDQGEIKQIGSPIELLFSPANDFVKDFLADAHLQLGLSVTKIHNVWPFLNSGNQPGSSSAPTLDSNTSLWNVMELMTRQNHNAIFLQHTQDSEIKPVTMADLLQAFTQYKTQR